MKRLQQSVSFSDLVAGVDEAGRGPLAGPVVAAAVILDRKRPIIGLADSKVLSEKRRDELTIQITARALAWSVAWADAAEIDRINILQATFLAMRRALLGLRFRPDLVEVDGNRLPDLCFGDHHLSGNAIVGGDARIPAISAASIIAKVHRDRMMRSIDTLYPDYGFRQHKGYPTAAHRDCLSRLGPCPQHRRSFRPVSSF
ncbi:MAG: ribonuclease HII [Proteobacteria bacterium]|nr:ribonuclease HII [Pseudomonadota bacterium]MDA0993379.1 ribonuclease HII [Pseudomonadota bacterium]